MDNFSKFWLLRFHSHSSRGEKLNIGLLYETEAGFEIRVCNRLEKLKAISFATDIDDIRDELNELRVQLNKAKSFSSAKDLTEFISDFSILHAEYKGELRDSSESLINSYINDLMRHYVLPEPALPKPIRKRNSNLRKNIRDVLKAEKVLARRNEGLDSHRVIYKHQLSEGVIADFVLQNGSLNIVESVDARSSRISIQKSIYEIALSTLTFEHARINYGNQKIVPRLVYTAGSDIEKALKPSLYAAEHQGAEIINWSSAEDQAAFINKISSLAVSTEENTSDSLFDASILPRRYIN